MRDDRHDRMRRADGDPRRRPVDGFRSRDGRRFRQLVDDVVKTLPLPATDALARAALTIVDVPARPTEELPLAEADADGDAVRTLVVYRRPAELRATDREDLVDLLREAILEATADAVGGDPDDWDDA